MIPEFEDNGQLPVGIIKPTLSYFESYFVTNCPESNTRKEIFRGYLKFCSKLVSLESANLQWVNGSFTTKKIDPNDIDFVTHIDALKLNNSGEKSFKILQKLNDKQRAKLECKCDAYFIVVYPPEIPDLHEDTLKNISYWSKWFAHDRNNNPKGLIEFDLAHDSFDIENCMEGK